MAWTKARVRISLLAGISVLIAGIFCLGVYASLEGLQAEAKAAGRYLCRDCGQHLDSGDGSHTKVCGTYVQHSTTYACDTCGGSFSSKTGHSRMVSRNCATDVDHYSCTRCGTVSESSHTITVNRNCASADGYNCSICGHVETSSHSIACTGSWKCTGTDSYIVCPSCGSAESRPDLPCSKCGKTNPMPVHVYYVCRVCSASRTDTMVPKDGVATYTTEGSHNRISCSGSTSVHYYCSGCREYKTDSSCFHGATVACYGNITAFYRCSECRRVTEENCIHSVSEGCPADSWSSSSSYRCSGCGSEGSGGVHTVSCLGQIVDAVHTLTYDISSNGGTGAPPPAMPGIEDGIVLDSGNSCWNEKAEKTGYGFVGWNTDQDAHKGLSELAVDGDKTLYAIFRKKVCATMHDISGEEEVTSREEAYLWNKEAKASITFPALHGRKGWTAVGWTADKSNSLKEVFQAGSSTDISGDMDFYALYRNTVSFPVDADGDGVAESMESADIYSNTGNAEGMEEGEGTVILPSKEPTKEGYVFGGWKDKNGDAVISQPVIYDEPQRLKKCAFGRDGYGFLGWSGEKSSERETYADGQEVVNLASESGAVVDLYAVFAPHRYEIIYEGCSGAEKEVRVDTSEMRDMRFKANWQEIISVSVPAASDLTRNGGKTKDTAYLLVMNDSLTDINLSAGFGDFSEGNYGLVTREEDDATRWSDISSRSRKIALYMEGDAGRKKYAGEDADMMDFPVIQGQEADLVTLVCRHAPGVIEGKKGCDIGRYAVEWQVALAK